MSERYYSIHESIFTRFPGYQRGVVLAFGVKNGPTPQSLVSELKEAQLALRQKFTLESLVAHPYIAAWREAYRAFGAKPSEFRPSMEAMTRRILNGNEIPNINTLVDLGNLISLRHLVPTGGHAIDHLQGDIALISAMGDEDFVAFGSDQHEHPLPGEVIFVEEKTVLTRRWTWRQAKHTLTLPETTAIEFNVDGLVPVTYDLVKDICGELEILIKQYCGGVTRWEILDQQHPSMRIDQ
jgi:DNA/RNA-binding domain of Phe-tRNA-synthetase-like protein